jgi:hypothetical protein
MDSQISLVETILQLHLGNLPNYLIYKTLLQYKTSSSYKTSFKFDVLRRWGGFELLDMIQWRILTILSNLHQKWSYSFSSLLSFVSSFILSFSGISLLSSVRNSTSCLLLSHLSIVNIGILRTRLSRFFDTRRGYTAINEWLIRGSNRRDFERDIVWDEVMILMLTMCWSKITRIYHTNWIIFDSKNFIF